jgi:predicted transcriptional regulator YdeE
MAMPRRAIYMQQRFVDCDAFHVMGLLIHGVPGEVDFAGTWMSFMHRHGEVLPLSTDKAYYGAWFGACEAGGGDYIAGMAVPEGAEPLEGFVVRAVPGGQFAAFACTVATIGSAYSEAYERWLPASAYERDPGRSDVEFYPPGTANMESAAEVWIPVRKVSG